MYSIYKIECSLTDNAYIGLTKQPIERRFRQHINDAKNHRGRTAIGGAIRKHGEQTFTISLIAKAPCLDSAMALEIEKIAEHKTQRPNGYNISKGGDAGFGWMTDEQRKRSREAAGLKLRGYKHDKSFGESISRTKKGVPLSIKNLESIRKSKGRKIRCIDTGDVFFGIEGYRAFAEKHNVRASAFSSVTAVCRGRNLTVAGMRFEYADGEKCQPKKRTTKKIKVICVDTDTVFCSVTGAAGWLRDNGYPKATTSYISKCCKGAYEKAYGLRWAYYVNT